jgi:hypothetical protein
VRVSWGGDYEFYARADSPHHSAEGGFGVAGSVTTVAVTTHTFTPADTAALPFLSIEEKIGCRARDVQLHGRRRQHPAPRGRGQRVPAGNGRDHRRASRRRCHADRRPDLGQQPAVRRHEHHPDVQQRVSLPAKSFSIDFTNNFEDDDYRLGSFYIGDLTPASREVTASFSIREKDSSLWRQAVYGVSSATTPGGLTTKSDLVITMQTYENVTGTTKGSITLTIPKFALNPYGLNASGADIIESDISGQALRPNPADPICTLTVVSANDTIA